ncbi:MAG: thiamine phosphate synthase, partial [Phycisphaerae bacterium]
MNRADSTVLRMMDANGNRVREALRVMEDYARFVLNDQAISGRLKGIRHGVAEVLSTPLLAGSVLSRDTSGDVGRENTTEGEMRRESLGSVVVAAGKRLSEALRVMEECAKTFDGTAARRLEGLRYEGYQVEQVLSRFAMNGAARERFAKVRLYVLMTESICAGGRKWEEVLDAVLGAARDASEICVQLREKGWGEGQLLRRARIVAEKCRRAGAVSIVNDRADIAVLAGADGVHVGQGDLPCAEVRKVVGAEKIVGVSTERVEEARLAVREGATYVAVGPMYSTTTKVKERIAGVGTAREVREALGAEVPVVAIGGITVGN